MADGNTNFNNFDKFSHNASSSSRNDLVLNALAFLLL